ncbi:MAG: hypothetical protein NT128_01025 [Proteobacteria bacterium]|nr:hypothetical protein [Pseudomonadota bacterium]
MIRYKILGADGFDKTLPIQQTHINSDMGHFSIGTQYGEICFEEVIPPPKQLWIKAQIEFGLDEDIPVIQEGNSFVWRNDGSRCAKVTVSPTQILYAQKDNLVDQNWQLLPSVFEHEFATVASIYSEGAAGPIAFWPCGGKVSNNILEIEQLYAQTASNPLEQKVYVNSLSACSKLMAKTSGSIKFLFHPPPIQKLSLGAALNQGLMAFKVSDGSLEYLYASIAVENPVSAQNTLQILCERKDQ